MVNLDWDEKKNRTNQVKHGWDFREAARVFRDPLAVEIEDRTVDYGEARYKVTGYAGDKMVTVVYADRDDVYRLISAYNPSPQERRDYEGNIG